MGVELHGSPVITSPLVNIFGEVEGGVQVGEAEADERTLCVCVGWVPGEFKASVLLRGHFLPGE